MQQAVIEVRILMVWKQAPSSLATWCHHLMCQSVTVWLPSVLSVFAEVVLFTCLYTVCLHVFFSEPTYQKVLKLSVENLMEIYRIIKLFECHLGQMVSNGIPHTLLLAWQAHKFRVWPEPEDQYFTKHTIDNCSSRFLWRCSLIKLLSYNV